MKIDSPPGRWQFMSISARMVKKSWNATQWHYCGQPLRRVCRWALRYWQKGYFMSNWKACRAASCWRISVIPLVLLSSLWPASNYLPKTPWLRYYPSCKNRQWATLAYLCGYGASCCWVIFSGQVLRRGHLNICQSSMKKLAMHLSKSAWMWWRTPPARCLPTRSFPAGWSPLWFGCFLQRVRQRLWWLYWWPGLLPWVTPLTSLSVLLKSSIWCLTARCTGAISSGPSHYLL